MLHYQDLTEKQKSIVCNGCGPKAWFLPVPEFFCHASCDHHDFRYWIGCTWQDRRKADTEFYTAMRVDAGWNPIKLTICLTFYLAVRAFGADCFHFADRQRDEQDLEEVTS